MNNSIAILGIHTGIGKTIASAVLAEAMGADYWKPVQAGTEEMDAPLVRSLITNGTARVHDEAIVLRQPMSPHAAAAADGVTIDYKQFAWPKTDKTLLVETAGGILSPMSADCTMADFVAHYHMPTILVVQHYLGSINHTLMSIEVLKSRGIRLLGLVINGGDYASSETFVAGYAQVPVIAQIPKLEELDAAHIAACAAQIKQSLLQHLPDGKH